MLGLRHRGTTLAHDAAIATYTPNAIFPALPVLPVALTLIDQFAKLGAAVVVLDFVRRQAGDDVIAVGEQLPYQSNSQRGQGRSQEPCSRGIVSRYNTIH